MLSARAPALMTPLASVVRTAAAARVFTIISTDPAQLVNMCQKSLSLEHKAPSTSFRTAITAVRRASSRVIKQRASERLAQPNAARLEIHTRRRNRRRSDGAVEVVRSIVALVICAFLTQSLHSSVGKVSQRHFVSRAQRWSVRGTRAQTELPVESASGENQVGTHVPRPSVWKCARAEPCTF